MKLFIIGNGFDLAHGLPTKYWNFRMYLENLYPDFLYSFEQHYYIYPSDSVEMKCDLLWNNFETNLANIDEDIIIEDAVNIDMGLEGGDYDIVDTLREYFRDEYKYIELLSKYLKQWIRTIKIKDVLPLTSKIKYNSKDFFINFNYTSVLENVYHINPMQILHIHGSLHKYTEEPIIGHGNIQRIENIKAKKERAECDYNEKEMSICTVIKEYYECTYKDVNKYMYKLYLLDSKNIDEIVVVGHSVSGIDLPYLRYIDTLTKQNLNWMVYYFTSKERDKIEKALIEIGINKERFTLTHCDDFYDLRG